MKEQLYKYGVLGLGTALMMISPYFIDTPLGKLGSFIGLGLLTIQTQKTKQFNLSLLNVVGMVGYMFSLIKQLLG
tara:strand:- start:276 stop:500 length:225 start_codon:yes stop_codon:yes gene_type:complete